MKYTIQRPKVAGFYWAKCVGILSGREYETIIKVYTACVDGDTPETHALRSPDTVFWDGENVHLDDDRLVAFAGPIPTPEGE